MITFFVLFVVTAHFLYKQTRSEAKRNEVSDPPRTERSEVRSPPLFIL